MKLRRDGDAVDAVGLGNRSDDRAPIDVDDFDAIAVRDVEAPGRGIDGNVVPTTRASDVDVTDDVIVGDKRRGNKGKSGKKSFHGAERYAVPRRRCKQFMGRLS